MKRIDALVSPRIWKSNCSKSNYKLAKTSNQKISLDSKDFNLNKLNPDRKRQQSLTTSIPTSDSNKSTNLLLSNKNFQKYLGHTLSIDSFNGELNLGQDYNYSKYKVQSIEPATSSKRTSNEMPTFSNTKLPKKSKYSKNSSNIPSTSLSSFRLLPPERGKSSEIPEEMQEILNSGNSTTRMQEYRQLMLRQKKHRRGSSEKVIYAPPNIHREILLNVKEERAKLDNICQEMKYVQSSKKDLIIMFEKIYNSSTLKDTLLVDFGSHASKGAFFHTNDIKDELLNEQTLWQGTDAISKVTQRLTRSAKMLLSFLQSSSSATEKESLVFFDLWKGTIWTIDKICQELALTHTKILEKAELEFNQEFKKGERKYEKLAEEVKLLTEKKNRRIEELEDEVEKLRKEKKEIVGQIDNMNKNYGRMLDPTVRIDLLSSIKQTYHNIEDAFSNTETDQLQRVNLVGRVMRLHRNIREEEHKSTKSSESQTDLSLTPLLMPQPNIYLYSPPNSHLNCIQHSLYPFLSKCKIGSKVKLDVMNMEEMSETFEGIITEFTTLDNSFRDSSILDKTPNKSIGTTMVFYFLNENNSTKQGAANHIYRFVNSVRLFEERGTTYAEIISKILGFNGNVGLPEPLIQFFVAKRTEFIDEALIEDQRSMIWKSVTFERLIHYIKNEFASGKKQSTLFRDNHIVRNDLRQRWKNRGLTVLKIEETKPRMGPRNQAWRRCTQDFWDQTANKLQFILYVIYYQLEPGFFTLKREFQEADPVNGLLTFNIFTGVIRNCIPIKFTIGDEELLCSYLEDENNKQCINPNILIDLLHELDDEEKERIHPIKIHGVAYAWCLLQSIIDIIQIHKNSIIKIVKKHLSTSNIDLRQFHKIIKLISPKVKWDEAAEIFTLTLANQELTMSPGNVGSSRSPPTSPTLKYNPSESMTPENLAKSFIEWTERSPKIDKFINSMTLLKSYQQPVGGGELPFHFLKRPEKVKTRKKTISSNASSNRDKMNSNKLPLTPRTGKKSKFTKGLTSGTMTSFGECASISLVVPDNVVANTGDQEIEEGKHEEEEAPIEKVPPLSASGRRKSYIKSLSQAL